MTAALQQVFSILMSTSLQRRFQSVFLLLKCSVCLAREPRLVCVLFVLPVLQPVIRTLSKWAALTTAGQISLLGVCVFPEHLICSPTAFLCLYLSILRSSSPMTLRASKESSFSISSAAVLLLYSSSHAAPNQQPVRLIRISPRAFRLFAASTVLCLFATRL